MKSTPCPLQRCLAVIGAIGLAASLGAQDLARRPNWTGGKLSYGLPSPKMGTGTEATQIDVDQYAHLRWGVPMEGGNVFPGGYSYAFSYLSGSLNLEPTSEYGAPLFLVTGRDSLARLSFLDVGKLSWKEPSLLLWAENAERPQDGTVSFQVSSTVDAQSPKLLRYRAFPPRLLDATPSATSKVPVPATTRNLVVLVHGWNPDAVPDGFRREPKDENSGPAVPFEILVENLQAKLRGSEWALTLYRWERDADTGGKYTTNAAVNGTEAAEGGLLHGWHLGDLLTTGYPNLEKVHLIAHSAGTWVARGAMRMLLERNPRARVQLTLLDPFMPNSVWGVSSSLGTALINNLDTLEGSERVFRLENYYAKDAVVFGTDTEDFAWRAQDERGFRVDWTSEGKAKDLENYDDHSGPVLFYADSVANTPPNRQRNPRLSPGWTDSDYGWSKSLFMQELVAQYPQNFTRWVSVAQGSPVTATVSFARRDGANESSVSLRWQKRDAATSVWTDLAGQSTNTLNIPSASSTHAGTYRLRAASASGNSYSTEINVFVEGSSPVTPVDSGIWITIDRPSSSGSYLDTSSSVSLGGRVSPSVQSVEVVNLTNGTRRDADIENGTWSSRSMTLEKSTTQDTENRFEVTARGANGEKKLTMIVTHVAGTTVVIPSSAFADVYSNSPSKQYVSGSGWLGRSKAYGKSRIAVQFAVSVPNIVPYGATIAAAKLKLRQENALGDPTFGFSAFASTPFAISSTWNSSSDSWNQIFAVAPGASGDSGTSNLPTARIPRPWDEWVVTSIVEAWLNGSTPNRGIALVAADLEASPAGPDNYRVYDDDEARLEVTYTRELSPPVVAMSANLPPTATDSQLHVGGTLARDIFEPNLRSFSLRVTNAGGEKTTSLASHVSTWQQVVELAPGWNDIVARAEDWSGNVASATHRVFRFAPTQLTASPAVVEVSVVEGERPALQRLTLTSDQPSQLRLLSEQSWLKGPIGMIETAGAQQSIDVGLELQSEHLRAGVHQGIVRVVAPNAADRLVEVRVNVAVSPQRAAERLVRSLYAGILARVPSAAELAAHTPALVQGRPAEALVGDLFESTEFRDRGIDTVARLYLAALGRLPDQAGLVSWSHELASRRQSLVQVATAFVSSPEFDVRYGRLDSAQFIHRLYLNALGRVADDSGLAYWLGRLNAGASRGEIVTGFSESAEFRTRVGVDVEITRTFSTTLGRMPTEEEYRSWRGFFRGDDQVDSIMSLPASKDRFPASGSKGALVDALYRSVLRREPDAGGKLYFVQELEAGRLTNADFVNALLSSEEYRAFVEPVVLRYLGYLARVPDSEGFGHWSRSLRSGMSSSQLLSAFAGSSEFRTRFIENRSNLGSSDFVSTLYRDVLGRNADPAGLAHWVAALDAGRITRTDLVVSLVESAEAKQRFALQARSLLLNEALLGGQITGEELVYWTSYLSSLPAQFRSALVSRIDPEG